MAGWPLRPVSARSGRKEFIDREDELHRSGGHSPFRGHGGVLKRRHQFTISFIHE
jgi:hypothetical protein